MFSRLSRLSQTYIIGLGITSGFKVLARCWPRIQALRLQGSGFEGEGLWVLMFRWFRDRAYL